MFDQEKFVTDLKQSFIQANQGQILQIQLQLDENFSIEIEEKIKSLCKMTGFKNAKLNVGDDNKVNVQIEKPIININESKCFSLILIIKTKFLVLFFKLCIND